MDARTVETRYLNITKRFGRLSGIWPYQSRGPKYFARCVIIVFCLFTSVVQVANLFIAETFDALTEQSPFFVATSVWFLKLYHYIVNEGKFKVILEDIFDDWKANRSKDEFNIMNMYGERAVFITTLYLVNGIVSSITFIQIPLVPLVLDIVSPLNVSRGIGYMFPAYYFVDEHRYYYLIVAHMICSLGLVLISVVACDSIYMYIVQHACGLLAVSSNRFRNAIEATAVQKEKDVDNDTYKKVCSSIQAHKRALKYLDDVENIYAIHFLILMLLSIATFSVTLLKVSKMGICLNFFKFFAFIIVQLVHLLLVSIHGQFVVNAGDDIYNAICESLWYNGPCKTQTLYLLVLRRTIVPPQFTAGRMIAINLRSYAEIIKVSVSYFTVLQST